MSSNMKYGRGKNPKSRNGFKRIYQLNEDFFGKTNEDSAYYAGFIAADGNISKNIKKLTITLQKRDQIILEEFNKKLQSTYKIRNCYSSGFPVSNLTVSSEKICLNLIKKFNITPCKSLTLKPPKIKNKKLIDCFIKGYLDGDGSVYYNEKSGLHISFLGTKDLPKLEACLAYPYQGVAADNPASIPASDPATLLSPAFPSFIFDADW